MLQSNFFSSLENSTLIFENLVKPDPHRWNPSRILESSLITVFCLFLPPIEIEQRIHRLEHTIELS